MEGFGLCELYRLVAAAWRLTHSGADRLWGVSLRCRDKPMDREAVKEVFNELITALPGIEAIIEPEAIADAAVAEHGKVHRYGWTLQDIAPEVGEVATVIEEEARRRIEKGHWSRLERAESWLADHVCADEVDDYGDQEALVYLLSRGRDCSHLIERLVVKWKQDAEATFRRFAEGHVIEDLDDPGKTRRFGQKTLQEAGDVLRWSSISLPNFWSAGASEREEATIDATMLRTLDWAGAGGFKIWVDRWAKEVTEGIAHEGTGLVTVGADWVFALCRCDLAVTLLGRALEMAVWAMQVGTYDPSQPWRILWRPGDDRKYRDNVGIASAIAFAGARVAGDSLNATLIGDAVEFIQSTLPHGGGWAYWTDEAERSIEATAMAIHALALVRPRGWQHDVKAAAEWLWSQQQPFGEWSDLAAAGGDTYLTVLVLDAIELAKGGTQVTFRLPVNAGDDEEGGATSNGGQSLALEEMVDHPRHVLRKLNEHLATFPDGEDARFEWKCRFLDWVWRWGDAIKTRPDMCERFLRVAQLHLSSDVRALCAVMTKGVAEQCRVLRERVSGAGARLDIRELRFPFGKRFGGQKGISFLDAVEYIGGEVQVSIDGGQIRWGDQILCPQEAVVELLAFCNEIAVPTLSRIAAAVAGPVAAAFSLAQDESLDAIGKLYHLLVRGRPAELWRAADTLLTLYHLFREFPDPEFTYPEFNYLLKERICCEFNAEAPAAEIRETWAPTALSLIELLTDWLCEQEGVESSNASGSVVDEGRADVRSKFGVLTETQYRILEETHPVARRATSMTADRLVRRLRISRSTFFAQVKPLMEKGYIANMRGIGYFRPDAPPKPVTDEDD